MSTRTAVIATVMIALALVVGCRKTGPTATSVPPTDTPVPPSPTATPTPTALLARVSGDPRKVRLSAPSPQSGAPCGVVDLLDFPINPPNAEVAFRGQDFGAFGSRYSEYHVGEDWWGPRGRSSFGTPVHSIAHGMVAYAAPLGWGVDKGVVIVRHVFSDGSTILSFYGHLDPPIVVLNAGDCVARGDQVGRIGRPRGPPHLHFEIRTHTPTSAGRGYWSGDPTLAGWKPPSQYIWNHRIAISPGVQWTRPFVTWDTKGIGMLNGDTFAAIENNRLIGVNVLDGSLRWSQSDSIKAANAMINVDRSVIYVVSQFILIEAFRLPDPQDGNATATSESSLVPMWKIKLDAAGSATLIPLPDGGVMVSSGRKMFGVSPAEVLLWEHDSNARVFDWALADDRLIFATSGEDGSIWTADESGPMAWQTPITGRPVVVGDHILVYAEDGTYRLNSESLSAELLYALPRGYLERDDIVALSDGGVLVTHKDPFDQRLIALNADGALRWQRSYSNMWICSSKRMGWDTNLC